jgi:hypothetical protein
MLRFATTPGKLAAAVLLLALPGFSSSLYAQPKAEATLEEILERLDANLHHYDTAVPSFFCDEHAVSKMWPRASDENTVTDSIFRLRRTPKADHSTSLVESREIRTVNGKPPSSQNIEGPTQVSGAFEGGLAVVSLDQTACMTYTLQPINGKHPGHPFIVRFSSLPNSQNSASCLLQEDSNGRAFIDPATMQLTHLEITTPHHVIIPGDINTSPVIGKRVLDVDYAPVMLGDQTFWMPSKIAMRATSGSGTFRMNVWTFEATYRNYHKLEVTSRIVPGSETMP